MTDEKDSAQPEIMPQAFPQIDDSAAKTNVIDLQDPDSTMKPASMPNMELVNSTSKQLAPVGGKNLNLGSLADIPITAVFEVGRQNISVPQLMELSRGSIVPLPNIYVDAIDVKINGTTIAKAETINLKQRYGVRLSELVIPPGMELD